MDLGADIIRFIDTSPPWLGVAVLTASAGIEYVFPPFPGDTVTLFGAFLVARRGWPAALVFAGILAGSAIGFMFDYWVGTRLRAAPERLRDGKWAGLEPGLRAIVTRFERHGAWYLTINRFIPSLRGLFFVAAGMAALPRSKVIVFGLLSAALWNAMLFVVGATVGGGWNRLVELQRAYGWAMLTFLGVVLAGAYLVWRRGR